MKRLFLISVFVLIHVWLFAATRYWVGGGTNTNWNSSPVTNWAATSGGAGNQTVPGASDDVFFDGAGNSASIISATITVLSFTVVSGYTNTITHNAVLTVAGNVTFVTGYTIAGSSGLTISAASTITSGGKTWPNAVTFSGANTKTLSGNWSITGLLTISAATTINTATLNIAGGFNHSAAAVVGTTTINLTGGTWTGAAGSATVSNPVTIAGNVTLSTNVGLGSGGSLTYTSGTVTTTSNTLIIPASITLNTAGISFNNITVTASTTITNNSLLTATGTFQINTSAAVTWAGTSGFSIATYTDNNNSARTQTFVHAVTYTITTALNCFKSSNASVVLFTSDDGTIKAILTLNNGATCNTNAFFTRIDASNGRTIPTFNGTITSCLNIVEKHDYPTVSKSFVQ